jgi:hypothetical protein
MTDPFLLFQRRRRIARYGGVVMPGLVLIAAVGLRHLLTPPYTLGSVVAAFMIGWVASRKYRCPFCEGVPEEDVPTFYPARCCRCGKALR